MTKNTSSYESNTRKIEVTDNKIIYTLKLDGVQDYLTYNETLLKILCMDRLKPFRDGERLRIKVRRNGSDQNMYLYDLAIACYQGMVKVETFLEDMQRYFKLKRRMKLSVDHADNQVRNNTKFNLSLMRENQAKADIVARIVMPALLVPAYVDGVYRVHFERRSIDMSEMIGECNMLLHKKGLPLIVGNPKIDVCVDYQCNTSADFVACLKYIADASISYMGIPKVPALRNGPGKWVGAKRNCWLDDIHTSMQAQEELCNRPIGEFNKFVTP